MWNFSYANVDIPHFSARRFCLSCKSWLGDNSFVHSKLLPANFPWKTRENKINAPFRKKIVITWNVSLDMSDETSANISAQQTSENFPETNKSCWKSSSSWIFNSMKSHSLRSTMENPVFPEWKIKCCCCARFWRYPPTLPIDCLALNSVKTCVLRAPTFRFVHNLFDSQTWKSRGKTRLGCELFFPPSCCKA